MTRIFHNVLPVVALVWLGASAGLPPRALADQGSSQQDKMKACNNLADNKGLKGDDRKNFLQDCLKKDSSQPLGQMSQQDKMSACKNIADKRNLTGSDRRSFLKDCMNKANPK